MRRLLVVGVVVVLLAIGATGLGVRNRTDLPTTGFTVDLVPFFGVLLVLALASFVLLLVIGRGPTAATAREPRRRSVLGAVIGLAVAALLFTLAVTYGPERGEEPSARTMPTPTTASGEGTPGTGDAVREPTSLGLLLVVLLVAVVVVAALLVGRRTRPRRAPTTADDLRKVIAEAREALSASDDPRAAVIAAYEAMERALADAGLNRRVADTPIGLLRRAIESGLLSPAAIEAAEHLTRLFERARFSERPLPAGVKDEATGALQRIDADLAAPGSAAGAPVGAAAGAENPSPTAVANPDRTEDRG